MSARLPTHNDLPTFECKLGRGHLVEQVALEIAEGEPPLVFGIHGDWGSGKTSFLCQLANELSKDCPNLPASQRPARKLKINNVFTVWFESWRYQHEPAPVVALLHEMCRQLPIHTKLWKKLKAGGAVMVKGVFGIVDEVSAELEAKALGSGGKVGVKFKNPLETYREEMKLQEEEHLTGELTSERVRRLLTEVVATLLGGDKSRRVCVIIDDLDRCDAKAALRLLEGIKIHLSLPQCVFVLGVNIRQIERAIAPLLPGEGDKPAEAAEYLEKLCTFTWKLPFLAPMARADLLQLWLGDPPHTNVQTGTPLSQALRVALAQTSVEFDCLPANPRKIKSLANTIRQLTAHAWHSTATASQELPVPPAEADVLLVAASIYQFHTELLRYLQTSTDAWNELLKYITGKSQLQQPSDLLKVLVNLRPITAPGASHQTATPGANPREPLFADPTHLNVFRVQDLLREATDPQGRNSIDYDRMKRYLDLPG